MFIEDRPSIDNRFRTLIAVFFGADITLTVPCYRKRDIYQSKVEKMMAKPPSYTVYRTRGKRGIRLSRLALFFYR